MKTLMMLINNSEQWPYIYTYSFFTIMSFLCDKLYVLELLTITSCLLLLKFTESTMVKLRFESMFIADF